jgi:hypothetical protein
MRIIASLPYQVYVVDITGLLFALPTDGRLGHRVKYPEPEINSLRRHAEWLERQGRQQCSDQWHTAANAIEFELTAGRVAA